MLQIEPLTVTDAIIRKVGELILDGRLKPGEKLPNEVQLAKEAGASRASVREALKALTVLRLLRRTRRGTYVSSDSVTILTELLASRGLRLAFGARHLYEARSVLEPGIAYLAAKRGGAEEHARLQTCIDRMITAEAGSTDFFEADREFHRVMARASGNDVLERLLDVVLQLLEGSHRELGKVPGITARSITHHRRLLAAISAGDGDRARRISQQNLRKIEQMYLSHLAAAPQGEGTFRKSLEESDRSPEGLRASRTSSEAGGEEGSW